MEKEITGKQKVLGVISHISYLTGFAFGFIVLPYLIYLYFKKTDEFIAYNARQAYIMQTLMFVLMLPFLVIALAAGGDAEAFGNTMGVITGVLFVLYTLVFLVLFLVFLVCGSAYATYKNVNGQTARYLPVMLYDKLAHDDTKYFPRGKSQLLTTEVVSLQFGLAWVIAACSLPILSA